MRQPHSSYEFLIKKQKPKYEISFVDWYEKFSKIGDKNVLDFLKESDNFIRETAAALDFSKIKIQSFFKDCFGKKLQLCENILITIKTQNLFYGIDIVADVMDIYEDAIQLIATEQNIAVCWLPSGVCNNQEVYTTGYHDFENFNDFVTYCSDGFVIIYLFYITPDKRIVIRSAKKEVPITREVIFEKY